MSDSRNPDPFTVDELKGIEKKADACSSEIFLPFCQKLSEAAYTLRLILFYEQKRERLEVALRLAAGELAAFRRTGKSPKETYDELLESPPH